MVREEPALPRSAGGRAGPHDADTHHDAAAVEVVAWNEGLQCVQEGHAPCNVKGKFHCLHLVHHEVCREGGSMSVSDSRGVPRHLWCVWEGVVVLAATPHTGCGEGMRAGD